MFSLRRWFLFAVIFAMLMSVGCGGGSSTVVPDVPTPVPTVNPTPTPTPTDEIPADKHRFVINLGSKGDVANAYLQVPELRGFEKFCQGRPVEEMP